MKKPILALLCSIALGAIIFSVAAQQAPKHGKGADQLPGEPDTPALVERVRALEALTRQQTKAITALAEDSKKLDTEVKGLRAELDELKKKVK